MRLKNMYREWYVKHHYYPTKHPRSKYLWMLLVVGALWGWSMDQDYQDQLVMEKLNHERTSSYKEALIGCLNGASGFYFPDTGRTFECRIEELQ